MVLSEAEKGRTLVIRAVAGEERVRRRLYELGIAPGNAVRMIKVSPFGSSFLVEIFGYRLAVRPGIAAGKEVAYAAAAGAKRGRR